MTYTLLIPKPLLTEIEEQILRNGFSILTEGEFQNKLFFEKSIWQEFRDSWNNLKLDTYMNDNGKYRHRRYSAFQYNQISRNLLEKPGEPHYQQKNFNQLNGGTNRYYEPLEYKTKANLVFVSIIDFCIKLFTELKPNRDWHLEVHQFRITTNSDFGGFPTPEGIHRDGVTYAFIMLAGKENGICLATHYVTWFLSLSYTSITASATIVTTSPIWVTLLSWIFFKEKPSRRTLLGISLALFGGLLIGYDGAITENNIAKNPLLGNFLALIGSWVYSLYFLAGREAQNKGLNTGMYAVIAYGSAALVLLPLPYFFHSGYTGYPAIVYLYIFLMAVLSQIMGQTCLNWSLRWVSPTIVTLAVMLEPIFSSIFAYVFFNEVPSVVLLIGAAILFLGVGTAAMNSK